MLGGHYVLTKIDNFKGCSSKWISGSKNGTGTLIILVTNNS